MKTKSQNIFRYPAHRMLAVCVLAIACCIPRVTYAQMDTVSENFSNVGNWQITYEHADTEIEHWCRAVGVFGDNELTILL